MKSLYTGFIAILMLFLSCKKEEEKIGTDNSLIGSWKWTQTKGGWGGTRYPSAMAVVTLTFYNDSTYKANVHGRVTTQGRYSIYSNGNYPVIHFDKTIAADKLYIGFDQVVGKIENGKLILRDHNVDDGNVHFFDQVK